MRFLIRTASISVALLITAAPAIAQKTDAGKSRFDTRYIASEFVGAYAVFPKQIHDSELVQKVLKEVDKAGDAKVNTKKFFAESKKELGVDIRNVARFVVLVDRELVAGLPLKMGFGPGGGPGGPGPGGPGGGRTPTPILSFIVKFTKPVDQKAVTIAAIKMLRETEMGVTPPVRIKGDGREGKPADPLKGTLIRKHAGKSYRVIDSMGICFPDDKTLLISHESLLQKMITAKGVKSTLTARLLSVPPKQDVILALDMEPFAPLFALFRAFGGPPDLAKLIDYLSKAKSLAVSAGLTGKTVASAIAAMPDKATATAFAKHFNDNILPMIRTNWAVWKPTMAKDKSVYTQYNIALIDGLLAGTTIVARGTDVQLAIARPKALDKLPELIAPGVKDAREAAKRSELKNNLHQIGIAFHTYHEQHGRFPGAGSDAAGKNKGLSWRVHLLLFLDEVELYKQFKLDEPWDSDHNKKLIPKMPKVFATPGVTEKGKTSLHVFVGKGTPFESGKRPRMADIHDGMTYTSMAVVAGPDKADIWTRPGGLPFDPKNDPFKALGKLPKYGLTMLSMDGAVHIIPLKTDKDTLKRLIQHADGKRVEYP